jgi:prepilin-type N-terminal cleavage/methylation domain-containing protein
MQRRTDSQAGFTLIEVLVVVTVIAILAAFAIGHLMRAKVAADEASAIATLRAVNSAQVTFRSSCGQGFFSETIDTLVDGNYVSPDANLTPKSGFAFELTSGEGTTGGRNDCEDNPTGTEYYFAAAPLPGLDDRRAFATDEGGTLWQDTAGVAPTEPFAVSGTTTPLQ